MRRAGQGDITAALGGEILSGARKPGERMPSDADMLKTFGVSRVVTREVIKTLAAKGLVASRMKVAELEFAFRMGRDLPPRPTPYTEDEVLAAVATLHPAIEIPDSRYEHFTTVGIAQLVADNACAHRFILGPAASGDWRGLDLAAHRGRAFRNGAPAGEGIGSNVLGGPVTALTWLANEFSRHGLTLQAGQVVTTGTCLAPLPIAAGEHIEGDLGSLGRVSVTIT